MIQLSIPNKQYLKSPTKPLMSIYASNTIQNQQKLQDSSSMSKANTFLSQLTNFQNLNRKQKQQFTQQFNQLNNSQKYACAQIVLSNAWGHINDKKFDKARKDLAIIIPLCAQIQQIQFDFPQFQIDRMLWQAWVNDQYKSYKKRQRNLKLLKQCGFIYQKNILSQDKQKKTFQKFLDQIICKCCSND